MKYDNLAEEVLDFLAGDRSWADRQSGDVDEPTGWFGLLDIPDREAAEAGLDYFLSGTGQVLSQGERAVTVSQMIGAWIVSGNSQGFAFFESFDSWAMAEAAFEESDARYWEWLDQGDAEGA